MPSLSPPSAVNGFVLGLLLLIVATGCNYNPIGPISTFGACTSGPYAVSRIAFVPADTLRIRLGRVDSVEVRALDARGDFGALCGPRLHITSAHPSIAIVSVSGEGIQRQGVTRTAARGVSVGSTVIRVLSGGQSDSLAVIVSP